MRTDTCFFCRQDITDGAKESGWTGLGPDWMVDGDFGCDKNPITGEEGCGGHMTREEAMEILTLAQLDGPLGMFELMRERLYGSPASMRAEADRLLANVCADLILVAKARDERPDFERKMRETVAKNLTDLGAAITGGGWPDPFPYIRHGGDERI